MQHLTSDAFLLQQNTITYGWNQCTVTADKIKKNISLIFGYQFKQKISLYTFGPKWWFLDGNIRECTGSRKLAGKLSYIGQLLFNFKNTAKITQKGQ